MNTRYSVKMDTRVLNLADAGPGELPKVVANEQSFVVNLPEATDAVTAVEQAASAVFSLTVRLGWDDSAFQGFTIVIDELGIDQPFTFDFQMYEFDTPNKVQRLAKAVAAEYADHN